MNESILRLSMPQILETSRFSQNCVARALFDNTAEAPDELSFRKGDVLTVLEQNTAGLEGWWLCSLKGRQGICPGNRLRLLAGVYDSGKKSNDELVCITSCRNSFTQFHKVVPPQNSNDAYLYDLPVNQSLDSCYDVPSSGRPVSTSDHSRTSQCNSRPESSGSSSGYGIFEDSQDLSLNISGENNENRYDTPKWPPTPIQSELDSYDTPRPMHTMNIISSPCNCEASLVHSVNESRCSSNRSSIVPDYDVPRIRTLSSEMRRENKLSVYDVPVSAVHPRELPLEMNSAIENLERLESEVTSAINKLLSYAGPSWREREKLQPKLMDIKLTVLRLRSALHDLTEFSDGVLGNALNAADKSLVQKLKPLTKGLYDTNNVVQESATVLDDNEWSIESLAQSVENSNPNNSNYTLDSLDQLIVGARCLTEDVKELASFIQGNATLLFKRNTSEKAVGRSKSSEGDYTNLEVHKALRRQHSEVRCLLSQEMQKSFDLLIKESVNGDLLSEVKYNGGLDHSDRKVLSFYASQCATHSLYLTHAIDACLNTVEHNQPPKVFIAHGKFVILSAHRLVHIGDTVHQNVTCSEVKTKVLQLSNALSESLATTVHKIKQAAMQFPSVNAVQEMVDAVIDVSHIARDLKMYIIISSQT